MVKDIGYFCKYNRPKQSTLTFMKNDLSSSASHTSSAINLTGTSISYQHDNKEINTNQNRNNTSNIYDIHACATP